MVWINIFAAIGIFAVALIVGLGVSMLIGWVREISMDMEWLRLRCGEVRSDVAELNRRVRALELHINTSDTLADVERE